MLNKLAAITQRLSPGLRQVLGNTSWLLADRIFQMGLALVVSIWVARYLKPQDYGLLTYAITWVSMFGAIADLGLGTIVVREIAREPSAQNKNLTLGTAFVLRLIGGVVTVVITVFTISLVKPNEIVTRWLVGIVATGTIFQAFGTIDYWFQSQLQSKYIVVSRNFVAICTSALRLGLIYIQAAVIAFAWAKLAETALMGLARVISYRINGNYLSSLRFSWIRAKSLLRESWPLILSGIAIYVYSKIDQVMLGSMLEDTTELGFYSVAVKLSEIFDFIPIIIAQSVLPKLAKVKSESNEIYYKYFQIYFDIMMLMWLVIALPVSLLSPYIIDTLYGQAYAAATPILSLYVWAQFGTNFGMARSNYLNVESKLQYSLYLSLSGAFINIALNFFLIPNFGAIGATIATIITYFIVIIVLNFVLNDLRLVGVMILRSLNLYKAYKRILGLVQ